MIFGEFLDVRLLNAARDFQFDRIESMNPC